MQAINKQKALLKSSASVQQLQLAQRTITADPHLNSFQHNIISNTMQTLQQ